MNLNLQYFIIGVIAGLCLAYVIASVRRRLRHPEEGNCASCESTSCPIRKK